MKNLITIGADYFKRVLHFISVYFKVIRFPTMLLPPKHIHSVFKGVCRLCFALFLFSGCENDPKDIDNWTKRVDMIEEAKNIESYLSQGGTLRAKLISPLMYRYQKDTIYTEFPKTLHVDFYDDSMRVESRLTALYGKYMENLNKVYLRDSVTVINVEGDTLRCPELWWDQNQ